MNEFKRVFIHIRPRLQLYVFLGFLFGLVIGKIPFDGIVLLGFLSWLSSCIGITLFNSYYDRDRGPVAGLERPPTVSESLFYGSLFFKSIALFTAVFVNLTFFAATIIVITLSVLYSHKYFRWKSNGLVAVFFNFIIGAFTFLAANSLKILVTTNQFVTGLFCSGFFLAGIYLLMQIHQVEEDRERGDVSFAVRFGKNSTIIFALVLFLLAGILGVSSFIFSELFFELSILVPYFVIGILLTIVWKKKNGPLSDYKIMSRITDYFSFTGSALLIIIYIVSNTW